VRKVKTLIGLWPELEEGNFLWDPQRLEWSQSAAECLKFSRQCYLCPIATAYGREFPICKMPYTVQKLLDNDVAMSERILGEFIGDGEVA